MSSRVLAAPWAQHLVVPTTTEASPWRRTDELVRLRRGVYVPRELWQASTRNEQFLWRVRAASLATFDDAPFSHLSAAAVWRLPMVGAWPAKPHVTMTSSGGGASTGQLARTVVTRAVPFTQHDGVPVTTLPRTLVDVARTQPLSVALPMIDEALAGRCSVPLLLEEIHAELAAMTSRGSARARLAVGLADARSGSPGESLSRAVIHECGFPMPELQVEFRDHLGRMFVDFYWPDQRLIGEFDGRGKYLREEMLQGRTPGEAVVEEKLREDRLRALGERVTRWEWRTARSLPGLRAHLIRAGLRPLRYGR